MSLHDSDPLAIYSIGVKLRNPPHDQEPHPVAPGGPNATINHPALEARNRPHVIPTLHTLERICRAYGISLGHFSYEPQHHYVAITRKAHTNAHPGDHFPRQTPLHVPTP